MSRSRHSRRTISIAANPRRQISRQDAWSRPIRRIWPERPKFNMLYVAGYLSAGGT